MVINSPCLIDKKELAIPGQMTTVDGQTIAITEASVRRHLQLADADGVHIPLFDTMLIHDQPGQGEGPTLTVESQHTPIASPSTSQPTTSQPMSSQEQPSQVPITEPITDSFTTSHPTQTPSPMPHDLPLSGGHTPRSDEGSKKLNELTELCTKLSNKVTSLEDDLKQTKKIYGKALTKLVKKVKQLEAKLKSTTERRKARMVISDDEDDLVSDDTSKQTKKIYGKTLTKLVKKVKQLEAKLKSTTERRKARMVISDDEDDLVSEDTSKQGRMPKTKYEEVEIDLNQTDDDLQRRSIIEEIDLDSTAGGLFSTAEEVQGKEHISTDEKVAQKLNYKEMARAVAREEHERIDFEKALDLQKQLDEREETNNIDWNTVAEQNMAGYKMGYFKGMSYDEIRPLFEEEYNKIQTLFKKDTEVEKTKTKRIAKETLLQESFKKLRTAEASRSEPI
ncbi:hypothetical protein Tco_1213655 [Tanacetum coccineum]